MRSCQSACQSACPSWALLRGGQSALAFLLVWVTTETPAAQFDAAPDARVLSEGNELVWDDPREIHKVIVHFADSAPSPENVHLEYWSSRWPEQRLPKDRQPGGADVGWMELGNWYTGNWRAADTEAEATREQIAFTFRDISRKEFPAITNYPASFRYTLKLRLAGSQPMPKIGRWEAFTDSEWKRISARLEWKSPMPEEPTFAVFNGRLVQARSTGPHTRQLELDTAANPDPNTFDRTLVTVNQGKRVFTFATDDLSQGPLFLPHLGVAVLAQADPRNYAAVAEAQKAAGGKNIYDRVDHLPEQTWEAAWAGIPRKKSDIYLPLGWDGGRQRFRLHADGSISFRTKDYYLEQCPGRDTPRLALEGADVRFDFHEPPRPTQRTIVEGSVPICETSWETNGLRISQSALITPLNGMNSDSEGKIPEADALAVCLLRFEFRNVSNSTVRGEFPISYTTGGAAHSLRCDENGFLWLENNLRGQVVAGPGFNRLDGNLKWTFDLLIGGTQTVLVKIPYLLLTEKSEQTSLANLDFDRERSEVSRAWRRRLDESSRLITPEPMLNDFYRAQAGHLLINCEREPDQPRRFARVGSFHYGAFGNESCMMVVELDRRGYHKEAQECLDAWLHYQGSVGLPGDFSSKEGILYGAGGYEDGGYNQHHGWILWCLVEHYRFTRDLEWLKQSSAGILAGAEWIIRETQRTMDQEGLGRGLLPAGRLEDIGDWWNWLSTSCYTWRGLDSAAWALEQLKHPQAARIRKEADGYHERLLANFRQASLRSPVVRLRDGTAIPQIPSYVQRRGRSFGWICQTLEGALHLIITRAIDARSQEADWIIKDYEDNLYLSNQYGYTLDDFNKHWFDRGGMSMQACLLFDVEPYLYRDNVKHALRALFNAEAVSYFPDVRMNTEHAAPYFDDWRGDHYKSSDEANACGWLRQLFVREEGDVLLLGQAIPRDWLRPGRRCGLQRAATYFGPTSILFSAAAGRISAEVQAPKRNSPKEIRLRFRAAEERPFASVVVNGKNWTNFVGDWVLLPGNIGSAQVQIRF